MKKKVLLGIALLLMFFGGNVLADEVYSTNFQNLTKDGKITIPAEKPKDDMEFQGVFSAFIGKYNTNEYSFYPGIANADYTQMDFCLQYENGITASECHPINISYIEVDKEVQKRLKNLLKT